MGPFWTFPNMLTLSRPFIGLPAIYLSLYQNRTLFTLLALLIFIFFSWTDWLDGWWARKNKVETLWGKVLDPASDKLFFILTTIFVGIPLALFKQFTLLIMLEVLLAIFGLTGIIMLRKNQSGIEVGANKWGKRKVWAEITFIGLLFIQRFGLSINIYFLSLILWLAMILAILSIKGHLKDYLKI